MIVILLYFSYFSEDNTFSKCTVVPMSTNETQDVRLAFIKNCTFRGNSADEFGSAISHNIDSALNKISGISNLLIENW